MASIKDRDPTLTLTLRRQAVSAFNRRFRELKTLLNQSIRDNDALGFDDNFAINATPASPNQFVFFSDAEKIPAFMAWLRTQENEIIFDNAAAADGFWFNEFINRSYVRGAEKARALLEPFLIDFPLYLNTPILGLPKHIDRLALLHTRSFQELKGINEAMDQQISRILSEGLLEGRGAGDIGKDIANRVDKVGRSRARLLARTEIIRAHNEASIAEAEQISTLIGEDVLLQCNTANDERVRSRHRFWHRVVYTVKEARSRIGEPNCRCAFTPFHQSFFDTVEDVRTEADNRRALAGNNMFKWFKNTFKRH